MAAPHNTHGPSPATAQEPGAALGTQGATRLPLTPDAAGPGGPDELERARAGKSGPGSVDLLPGQCLGLGARSGPGDS